MKKYFIFLLILLLFYTSIFSAVVSSSDFITVRVGIYENSPKIFTSKEDNASGFWPDIIEYIASEEGWEIEYVHGTWTECLTRLENNEIDIMPDVAYTEERSILYNFSKEDIYLSWSRIYTRKGIDIQSILDLEGKNIAVLKGSVNVEGSDGIKKLVSAFHINCTFTEVDSYTKVFELVDSGDADAGVTSKDFGYLHEADFNVMRTVIIFQPASLYFAFSKNSNLTPYLIERVDYHVKKLKDDEGSIYYQSLEKWLGVKTIGKSVIPEWIIWALIGIGGLAFLLAGGSFILRSQVKSKTKEITAEIIEHKRTEDALDFSEQLLNNIIEQSPVSLWISDGKGTLIRMNQACRELFGVTNEEAVGKYNIFKDNVIEEQGYMFLVENVFKKGEVARFTINYDRSRVEHIEVKEGTHRILDVVVSPIRDVHDKLTNALVQHNDITKRRQEELKLIEAYQKIKTHTKELEIINEHLDSFAYSVSHDLRSPLRAISGFSQVLIDTQGDKVNEEMRHYLNRINEGAQKMGQLIDDLLSFSRSTRKEIKYEKINVEEIVNDLIKAYRDVELDRDIEFIVNPLGDVEADKEMIKVVFSNLIQNAIKFTIDRKKACIEIGRELIKDDILFYVKDNGIGFDMRYKDKLFTAFQRLHTDARFSGTGIGLSTVKRIVLKHGGNIWAKGEVDKGAEFYFTLPSKTHVKD